MEESRVVVNVHMGNYGLFNHDFYKLWTITVSHNEMSGLNLQVIYLRGRWVRTPLPSSLHSALSTPVVSLSFPPAVHGWLGLNMSARNQVITQQIQQDWVNREYIEVITSNIKRIADFLNSFDMSCRSKLSQLNEKLTMLERRIEYLEARVTKGETLN